MKPVRVNRWSDLFFLGALTVLYTALGKIMLSFFSDNAVVSIVWPSSGVALAALLIFGLRAWPVIFISAFAANILSGSYFGLALPIACGNTLEAVGGAWLLSRFTPFNTRFNPTLAKPQDYLLLVVAGSLSCLIAASVGAVTLWHAGVIAAQAILPNLVKWWQGDTLGIILVAPLVMVWRQVPRGWFKKERAFEVVGCFGLAFLFGQITFLEWYKEYTGQLYGYWMFLFVAWSALRFGRHGVLLVISAVTAQALLGAVQKVGFFAHDISQTGLNNLWFYIMVLTVVGVTLALTINNSKQADASLRDSESRLRESILRSPNPTMMHAEDGEVIMLSDAWTAITGYRIEDIPTARAWAEKAYGVHAPSVVEQVKELFELREATRHGEYPIKTATGKTRLWDFQSQPLPRLPNGKRVMLTLAIDVTERRQAEKSMQLATLVYETSSEAMMVTDAHNTIVAINPAFTDLTGYSADDVIGKNRDLLKSGLHDAAFYESKAKEINATGHWRGEVWSRKKNGEVYVQWLTINTSFNNNGSVNRRVSLFSDITKRKQSEELIWQQANFDSLTGLPNRRMLHDRLEQEIKKAHRANLPLAVMFIDLDRFKDINDTLGHGMGDIMLVDTARRLRGCVRESDTVARLGGDEFTVILGELHDSANVERVAQQIRQKLAEPYELEGEVAYISASIGITFYPDDATEINDLLKNADQAMYAAKNQGRNRCSYFTRSMQEAAQSRMRLVTDLRGALAAGQFLVHYQPIIELVSGAVYKAEALIRWKHPKLGMISPAEFIPIAEEIGLIVELGDWVFRQAAQQAKAWRGAYHPSFQISVNASPVQFHSDGNSFAKWFTHLDELDLIGESIAVEITEGLLLDAGTGVAEKLLAFRDAGIQVALDDFGTGYSSLSYLKKFDIDYLKIDQSFVRNLAPDSNDMVLSEAIIGMAHKLGLKVVAEGVETEEQHRLLAAAGCDFAQGYLFSRPVSAEDFEKLFAAR